MRALALTRAPDDSWRGLAGVTAPASRPHSAPRPSPPPRPSWGLLTAEDLSLPEDGLVQARPPSRALLEDTAPRLPAGQAVLTAPSDDDRSGRSALGHLGLSPGWVSSGPTCTQGDKLCDGQKLRNPQPPLSLQNTMRMLLDGSLVAFSS